MSKLSVVLPAYNEEPYIRMITSRIAEILSCENILFEIVIVDDGSNDGTWSEIDIASRDDDSIVGIRLSRNFGKEAAIIAGLAHTSGDCCVVLDCDMQHPLETIVEMYRLWEKGFEIVEGIKKERGEENHIRRFNAKVFYKLISKSTGIDMSRASDFKLLDRRAVDALLALPERNTFFRAMSSWVGFNRTHVEFDVAERMMGKSKWSTYQLAKYALKNIAAFSTAPMQLVTFAGTLTLMFAAVMAVDTMFNYFTGKAVEGFTTVILIILIIGSIIMISLGIIGYYIARIYEETKRRSHYIISKIISGNRNDDR